VQRTDDVARAIEATLRRGGAPYVAVTVTGDTQGVSIDDDTARRVLEWRPVHCEPWLETATGHGRATGRRP
jgi:hypothetical protein